MPSDVEHEEYWLLYQLSSEGCFRDYRNECIKPEIWLNAMIWG